MTRFSRNPLTRDPPCCKLQSTPTKTMPELYIVLLHSLLTVLGHMPKTLARAVGPPFAKEVEAFLDRSHIHIYV